MCLGEEKKFLKRRPLQRISQRISQRLLCFHFEALANGNANANGSDVDGGSDASASDKELEAPSFGQGLSLHTCVEDVLNVFFNLS